MQIIIMKSEKRTKDRFGKLKRFDINKERKLERRVPKV